MKRAGGGACLFTALINTALCQLNRKRSTKYLTTVKTDEECRQMRNDCVQQHRRTRGSELIRLFNNGVCFSEPYRKSDI